MSGTGGMRWDDPFRTGQAGFYDPGTMKGLILRAQRGDRAALNHLKQSGFTDEWGNFSFSPDSIRAGAYDDSINQWATGKGLQKYTQGPAFNWNQSWASGDPSFSSAWDAFFSGQPGAQDQRRVDQSTNQQQPVTTPMPGMQPGSGYGVQYNNTPQTVAQGQQNNGWASAVPDWTNGGGYKFGWNYDQRTGWHPGAQQAAGTMIGAEVGWNTPMYLPVAYNPQQDSSGLAFGNNENAETVIERAMRYTTMAVQQNKNLNAQHVFEYYLASFGRDAAAKGQNPGFDLSQFGGTTYGDKYNAGATYFNGQRPTGYQSAQGGGNAGAGGGNAGGGGAAPGAAGAGGTGGAGAGAGAGNPGAGGAGGLPGAGGGAAGGGGPNDNLTNIALFNNPQAQMARLYRQLGIDPLRDNAYVNSIVDTLNPVLQAWVQTDQLGTGGVAVDNIQNRIRDLGNMFSAGGGGFTGVRNEFRGLMGRPGVAGVMDDLGDQGSRDLMQTIAYGANAGANDLYSRALKNRFNRAFAPGVGAYDQYTLDNLGQPTLNPRQWLLQSQWADLLNGL